MPPLLPGQRPPRMGSQEISMAEKMDRQMAEMIEQDPEVAECDIICHDTRGESYRDPNEGSLIVRRAPHEVRPPADTGVVYSLDSEGGLSLSLRSTPRAPEYKWNSFELRTEHPLCQACRDVFNYYCQYQEAQIEHRKIPEEDRPRFALSNTVVHHYNIMSLHAWAVIDKCWLCQILLKKIKQRFGNSLGTHNYEDFRTQAAEFWNFSHFYRMEVWPVEMLPRHYDQLTFDESSTLSKTSELGIADHLSTKLPKSQALARSWLSQCKSNESGRHQECNRRDNDYMPTRLLDVRHAQKTSRLRLVCSKLAPEPLAEDKEWMTLSHCWGQWGARENPILVKANLQERCEAGLKVSELPQTFQDTLEIAGWFGINWLWIDCLCIIQDSKEDWLRESGMMSEIYQNAQINISADIGADSRMGCFTERDTVDITPLEISCPKISQTWKILPKPYYLFEWVSRATSLSRAWIHRERQLARRILHFTDTELVWECCGVKGTAFASEMLPMGGLFEFGLFNMDQKYQIGRLQQGLTEGDEETYATWNDVCEKLSEKNLTQPLDMPMVLSGLAKNFASNLPGDKYIAGVWNSTLPHSLLWKTRVFKPKDLEYIAPSWSWLSTGCAVTLANRSSIAAKHPVARILNEDVKLKYDDPYGSIESGTLKVEGVLRQIRISFEEDEQSAPDFIVKVFEGTSSDGSSYEEWRTIGNSWDDVFGVICELELDSELEETETFLDCFCLFVTLQQWFDSGASRDLACLLLQPVGDDMETFRRVGTIVFKYTFALKMRYWTARDIEDDIWDSLESIISNVQLKLRSDLSREAKDVNEIPGAENPSDTTRDTKLIAEKQRQDIDALYQFDNIINSHGWTFLSKLGTETLYKKIQDTERAFKKYS
ncbi:hypothetical protein VTL71DRAFT_11243 [Oculimacula yallundae]|uniref:Heterokaryon incompatibility domain-containing protein n=1 Tax=Oculimacula yallundae TaxID=86028 RepID=A0ABR4CVQ6_9HELO